MFNRNRPQIDLGMIDPSSKMTLKMSCVQICNGDMAKANEMYDFFAKDLELPDYPPKKPSTIQQIQQAAGNIFGWVRENQGDLVQAYNFIQQLRGGKPIGVPTPPVDIPPLPPTP